MKLSPTGRSLVKPRGEAAVALGGRRGLARLTRYLYLLPALALLVYVVAYPLLTALYESLQNLQLTDLEDQRFVGLANYALLFHDEVFWHSFLTTIVFSLATVVASFLLGLWFAALVEALPPAFAFVRGLLMAPWVQPSIVVGFLFLYIFDQDVGLVNLVLNEFHLVSAGLPWLAADKLSLTAVIVANVWSQTPFFLLMFSATIAGIPQDLRDAMRIDGATSWREFVNLTLPFLRNVMVVSSILMLIRSFNNFPVIWTMTQGGPVYATTTLVIYIYRLAFEQFNLGYAAAIGVIWLLVLMLISAVYIRLIRREPLI
jgi:multiple sugar transport system permease protein